MDDKNKYAFVGALSGIAILLVLTAHNYLGFPDERPGYPGWALENPFVGE